MPTSEHIQPFGDNFIPLIPNITTGDRARVNMNFQVFVLFKRSPRMGDET